jgi:hypothetical protein
MFEWLRRRLSGDYPPVAVRRYRRPRTRPMLEALEDRVAPATWTVDLATDTGGAGGTQTGPNTGDLRYCVTHAQSGDIVQFDPTVFTNNQGQGTTITLQSGEIATSQSLTIQNSTGNLITIKASSLSRIFDFTDPQGKGLTETINNLILANGSAPNMGEPQPGLGGAIYDEGSLSLTGDQFNNNNANGNGGAIYNKASGGANTVTATNTKFNSNNAYVNLDNNNGFGGGIDVNGSNVTLHGCGFTSNHADRAGGAVNASGTGQTLSADQQSSFVDNSAGKSSLLTGTGGAIWSADGLTLTQDTFTNNSALQEAGAVSYYATASGSMTLTNETFASNAAPNGGAVSCYVNVNTGQVNMTITGSLFNGNNPNGAPSPQYGGGLYVNATTTGTGSSSLKLTNDTFYQNNSDSGGGIALALNNTGTGNNTAALTSLTVYQNTGYYQGGGLWGSLSGTGPTTVTLHNSIIAGNSTENNPVSDGPDILILGVTNGGPLQFISQKYNLIGIDDDGTGQHQLTWTGSDYVGFQNAPEVPSLDPTGLQWNGGPTQTIKLVPPSNGQPGGGYQQGDPTLAGTTDQRGYTRTTPVSIGAEDPGATPPG